MAASEHYHLRPMAESDLDMVLGWRNSERVSSHMYTTHTISETEHRLWWTRVSADRSFRYYIFELDGRPVGVVNLAEFDAAHGTASWGYYLGVDDAPPGTGAAMEFFALEEFFLHVGVRKLTCGVLAYNVPPLRLHEKFGFSREGVLRAHKLHDGQYEDVILLALFAEEWPEIAKRMTARVFRDKSS